MSVSTRFRPAVEFSHRRWWMLAVDEGSGAMPVVRGDLKQALAPTGVLRASINLGNPVLAQGGADDPRGVTVDLARSVADELDVPISFVCFDAARSSFEALTGGEADIAFLAIEPARVEQVAFAAPYVIIDGVFVVPVGSAVTSVADVDRVGVRIGVKRGSAYDLYLTRTLKHADLVRGDEGWTSTSIKCWRWGPASANRWSCSLPRTRAIA